MHVAFEAIDDLANTGDPACTRERGCSLTLEDRAAENRASVVNDDLHRAWVRHGTAQARANALGNHDIIDVRRWRMDDALGETVHAVLRIAYGLADQLAFDAFGMRHRLLDARSALPAPHRIEEVHEARTDQHAPGETR
jgi:hypothetical protein